MYDRNEKEEEREISTQAYGCPCFFAVNTRETKTRQDQPKLHEVYWRSDRYKDSPLSYLTNLLNNNHWWSELDILHLHCHSVDYWDIRSSDICTLQWCLLVLSSVYNITWQNKPSLLLLLLLWVSLLPAKFWNSRTTPSAAHALHSDQNIAFNRGQ